MSKSNTNTKNTKKIKYYGANDMIDKANSIKNIEAFPYSDGLIQVIYSYGKNKNNIFMSTIECTDESLEEFIEYVMNNIMTSKIGTKTGNKIGTCA